MGLTPKASAQLILAGTDMAHRAYGLQPQFQSVGWLSGTQANGTSGIFGTATLIHPQYVLFAAHQTQVGGIPATTMKFSLSSDVYNQPPNYVTIDQWYTHPAFIPTPGQGIDLAVGRLATPITSVTPAQLYEGTLSSGMALNFASYGYKIEYPGGTQGEYDGIKRGGTNILNFIDPTNPQNFQFSFSPAAGGTMTPFEMNTTNGGSGSSIFGPDGTILGVSSYATSDFLSTYATSLDVPWIQSITVVPEPSGGVLSLTVVGIVGMWRLMQRRRESVS
jgi:hypothetical protein